MNISECTKRLVEDTKGIVLTDVIETATTRFFEENRGTKGRQFKRLLANHLARMTISYYDYQGIDFDINHLADHFLNIIEDDSEPCIA